MDLTNLNLLPVIILLLSTLILILPTFLLLYIVFLNKIYNIYINRAIIFTKLLMSS